MNKKRYLITTSDEKTWKFDRPVIFLGEWCKLYSRKHIWQKMDYIVAEPYGLGVLKKDQDYSEIKKIEKKIFSDFCKILNDFHKFNHSERFWYIVVGPWFRRILQVILNRVKTCKQLFIKYNLSGTTFYNNDEYCLASLNFLSAIESFNDDKWNNILIKKIFKFLNIKLSLIDFVDDDPKNIDFYGFKLKNINQKNNKKNLLHMLYKLYNKFSNKLIRDSDAFILNSYLPIIKELQLELSLGQLPQIWRLKWNKSTWPEINLKPKKNIREDLTEKLKCKTQNYLEDITRNLLFELLPVCYLEGLREIEKNIDQQPWPKSPRFVFTSNNFNTDEFFKLWLAKKVENGTKYFVGQHGSQYGTNRYKYKRLEEITPDKFITWGWKDGLVQHVPAYVLNTAGQERGNYNKFGSLLLIETIIDTRFTTSDIHSEFLGYLNDQIEFVEKLDKKPKQNLLIRLHSGYKFRSMYEKERWLDYNKKIKIEDGSKSIKKLIADSRLVIYGYDSTGMLETLSQNIPTLAFWRNDIEHLRESAKPYYNSLIDSGIIHSSPHSLAKKINDIWSNVEEWWQDKDVQNARIYFCNRYAKTSSKPISDLKKILID